MRAGAVGGRGGHRGQPAGQAELDLEQVLGVQRRVVGGAAGAAAGRSGAGGRRSARRSRRIAGRPRARIRRSTSGCSAISPAMIAARAAPRRGRRSRPPCPPPPSRAAGAGRRGLRRGPEHSTVDHRTRRRCARQSTSRGPDPPRRGVPSARLVYTTLDLLRNGRPSVEVVIVPDAAAGGETHRRGHRRTAAPQARRAARRGHRLHPAARLPGAGRQGARPARWTPARARVCQLDEYVGLPAGHPESYRSVVLREVVEPLGLSAESFMGPDGAAEDVQAACDGVRRARWPRRAGSTSSCSGIGTDGHIGFNEPCSSLASRTRIKTLTEQTRVDNARFFGGDIEQVPHHVITQGIGTILEARHLVLLATGEGKAEAVALDRRGPGRRGGPGLRAPAPPARHGRRRRGGRLQAEARRLLPRHLRRQARLAGPLTPPGPAGLGSAAPRGRAPRPGVHPGRGALPRAPQAPAGSGRSGERPGSPGAVGAGRAGADSAV